MKLFTRKRKLTKTAAVLELAEMIADAKETFAATSESIADVGARALLCADMKAQAASAVATIQTVKKVEAAIRLHRDQEARRGHFVSQLDWFLHQLSTVGDDDALESACRSYASADEELHRVLDVSTLVELDPKPG